MFEDQRPADCGGESGLLLSISSEGTDVRIFLLRPLIRGEAVAEEGIEFVFDDDVVLSHESQWRSNSNGKSPAINLSIDSFKFLRAVSILRISSSRESFSCKIAFIS